MGRVSLAWGLAAGSDVAHQIAKPRDTPGLFFQYHLLDLIYSITMILPYRKSKEKDFLTER
jgi:hypothetical protein